MLTDADIAALSPGERRRLIRRLTRSLTEVAGPPDKIRRIRQVRLTLMIGAVLVLIPWIVYLGITLPDRHVTTNWSLTWVGFDVVLLMMFALTALLGLRRRQLVVLAAVATATLLVCDAWFDITTSGAADRPESIATAVLVELPVAALCLNMALRFVRIQAERMWLMPPAQHLWQVPLSLEEPSSTAETAPAPDATPADRVAPA